MQLWLLCSNKQGAAVRIQPKGFQPGSIFLTQLVFAQLKISARIYDKNKWVSSRILLMKDMLLYGINKCY
jgi:hypothetical protein